MPVCPMCKATVAELKRNCHVLPRAWAKRTKMSGQNIVMDFKKSKIAINQTDYSDDYWCADCEKASSVDDAYGAAALIHGTEGSIKEVPGKTINWKELLIDYPRFKKFLLSIAIRDHLARNLRNQNPILSEPEFEFLRAEYLGCHDQCFIVGSYVSDLEPLSQALTPPVRTRNNDGVSFQLFNFGFMIYFASKKELEPMSLSRTGFVRLPIVKAHQTGSLKDVGAEYQKIVENPENEKQLANIKKKYP